MLILLANPPQSKGLLAAPRLTLGGVEALEALRSQEKGFASSNSCIGDAPEPMKPDLSLIFRAYQASFREYQTFRDDS